MSFSLSDPLVRSYVIAACIMIFKALGMSWLTVARMIQVKGGYRSPEDIKKTPLNPEPHPGQLAPDDRVDRVRRIHLNDLESVPFFLVAGLLFLLTAPPLWLAQLLFYGYVASRMLHFAAYLSARTHDTRAWLWSVGSVALLYMTGHTLYVALGF
jgi:glutathione S-transferase